MKVLSAFVSVATLTPANSFAQLDRFYAPVANRLAAQAGRADTLTCSIPRLNASFELFTHL
jgi:hypothetical protein